MNNPLGVSPSKGNQVTTRGKEKIFDLRGRQTDRQTFCDISVLNEWYMLIPSESTGFTTDKVVVPSLSRRRKPIYKRKKAHSN